MYILIAIDNDNIVVTFRDDTDTVIKGPDTYSHDDYVLNPRTFDDRINLHKRRETGSEGNYSDPPYRSWPSSLTIIDNDTSFTTESQPLPDPIEEEET